MLSTTSEYALRALVYLAAKPKGTAVLGRELAEACGIPANYLSKILLTLRNARLLDAVRGSGGGYSLHRDARRIHLAEVVELFEGSRARPECFLGHHKKCSDSNPCTAHQAWREVRRAYIRLLESTTLAEISEGGNGSAKTKVATTKEGLGAVPGARQDL